MEAEEEISEDELERKMEHEESESLEYVANEEDAAENQSLRVRGDFEEHSFKTESSNADFEEEEEETQQLKELEIIPSEKMLQSIVFERTSEESNESLEKIGTNLEEDRYYIEEQPQGTEHYVIPTPESITEEEIYFNEQEEEFDNEDVSFPGEKNGDIVTVKFKSNTEGTMTATFNMESKIIDLKGRLAKIFKVKVGDIRLDYEDQECDDLLPLSGLGAEPLGTIELGIRSTDPERVFAPGTFSRYIPVVDVITVRVKKDDECFKYIIVEIENQSFAKEWLGGYRHRTTKVEYHHASVQTLPRRRPEGGLPQFSRETQTPVFPLKDIGIDTTVSKATQMWRTDHYIPNVDDKILIANPNTFIHAIEYSNEDLHATASKIQMYYRAYLKRQKERLQELEIEKCKEQIKKEKENKYKKQINNTKNVIFSSTFPLKRGDFYMLYLMVGKWWKSEINKVKRTKHNECKKAAFIEILEKEIELLSIIEHQRIIAKKEMLMKQEMKFVETTARPIIFRNNEGIMSSIDTVETQQAREYQEILSSFLNFNVSKRERIDTLVTLKELLKNFESEYQETVNEIVQLLERECNLLMLGMSSEQLKGLRDRVLQLLLFFLHQYVANPSSKNYRKPGYPKTVDTLYECVHCKKLKPACDFNVHVKMKFFNNCYSCEWIRNIGHKRTDQTPFANLLKLVRESEMANCCYSSNCFVLQVTGMQYLVEQIWQSKSILSDDTDMNNLRMARFRKDEEWSPWNCILLTVEETAIHLSVKDVNSLYGEDFIKRILWRHKRARNHFLPLLLSDKELLESKLWFNIQDSGKFLHPAHVNKFAQHDDFEHIS